MAASDKDPEAFRTIGELSNELGVAQHILRYWETKFPQLRPLQRAGNRRYYRLADVELARRIHHLLSNEGYTVRGVQKLLGDRPRSEPPPATSVEPESPAIGLPADDNAAAIPRARLEALRDRLLAALDE